MTYDTRTRRTQRLRKARLLGMSVAAGILIIGASTFFSMHVYWTGELATKLAFRLTGGRTEFAEPMAGHGQEWKERSDLPASLTPELSSGRSLAFQSPLAHQERQAAIDRQMRRDKFRKITVVGPAPLALLREQSDRAGLLFLHKQVLALLPGETVELPASAFSSQSPRLVFRCLGATADRLDLPGRLQYVHATAGEGVIPISPRGEPVVYQTPTLGPQAPLRLRWSEDAPGILVLAGEHRPERPMPGVMVVSLEETETGMESLTHTLQEMKRQGFHVSKQLPVWPANVDQQKSTESVFGSPVGPGGEALPAHLAQLGLTSLRIRLDKSATPEQPWDGFSVDIDLLRQREIRLALKHVLAKLSAETLTGGLLSLQLNIKPSSLGLTWRSALESDFSLPSWLFAAWLGKALAPGLSAERQADEKRLQMDEALAGFLSTPAAKGIGHILLLAHRSDETKLNPDAPPVSPGELLLASRVTVANLPSVRTAREISRLILTLLGHPTSMASASIARVQMPRHSLLIAEDGWMALPVLDPTDTAQMHVATAKQIAWLTEVRRERESQGLRTLHLQIPSAEAHGTLRFVLSGMPEKTSCRSAAQGANLRSSRLASGEWELVLVPPPGGAHEILCEWPLPWPGTSLRFQAEREGVPIPPTAMAFGPFALSGQLFIQEDGHLLLSTVGEFAPALIPPRATVPPRIHAWLDDFSATTVHIP